MKGNITKDKIFMAALELFSRNNYFNVTMRDLADQAGIRPPSIYNHYASKEDLLVSIYDYFDKNMQRMMPNLDELLGMVGTVHPHEILRKTSFMFPQDILEPMAKAMLIASSQIRSDPRADGVIFRNLVNPPYYFDPPLLQKMMDMRVIEPLDTDSFALLHSSFCHSTAVLFYHDHMVNFNRWKAGLEMLYSVVQVKCAIDI